MDIDTLCVHLNHKFTAKQSRLLNPAEIFLLRGIWQYQTYSQIAEEVGYSAGYLTNVVAPELLHRLSDLVGQRVTKKNCRFVLEEFAKVQLLSNGLNRSHTSSYLPQLEQPIAPAFPSGAIAGNSPFYILRPPIENRVCEEICRPGALIRVKAPKEMGKTSLLLNLLNHAQQQSYRTVYLNLEQLDRAICTDLNRFLRSLCISITHQLHLEPKLDDYWDTDMGSNVSCSLYVRQNILEQVKTPIVLVLDELHRVFEFPHVAQDVLPLLRSWYEEAKRVPVWQNLRLVIAHSTEVYVPLQLHQSPFNVGLAIQLFGFTLAQVQELAQRYRLDWSTSQSAHKLMALVGGHPALIHTTIYYLSRNLYTLDEVLETALTPKGIYHHHLECHWAMLQQQPMLLQSLQMVLETDELAYLESPLAHQLSSMGLINYSGNRVTVSCELYRQYFQTKPLTT